MYNIIALIGEAGSGKDTIMRRVVDSHPLAFNEIISCTTRPKREGEVEGINYHYLTPSEFTFKVLEMEMLEATEFNGWFYGTSYDSLRSDVINIGVFNPDGIRGLLNSPGVKVSVFKVECSPKTRLLRQLNREENPNIHEIIRRFSADLEDFDDLEFSYTILNNENLEDMEKAIAEVVAAAGQN